MKLDPDRIRTQIREYYNGKLAAHGATPRGVDWNSEESQEERFEQILKVCGASKEFSICDYGCGYGALAEYMARHGYECDYYGFDISEPMVRAAEGREFTNRVSCEFTTDVRELRPATYAVASGIFNVKLRFTMYQWRKYVLETLSHLDELGRSGFAFNMLTRFSDRQLMRKDLYYADPLFHFEYCKKRFSPYVALLHDYPLYEFTILVRKGR